MLSHRGIAVRPGAISLTDLASPSSLVARASPTDTTKRIWIITGVVILVSLVVIGVFCAVVLCLMYKKKQQRKKQHLDLGVSNSNHRYRPVDDMELEYGGVQELPASNSFGGGGRKAELGAHTNEVPKVQQLDGYVAPPKPSAHPAELPSNPFQDNYR